MINQRCSLVFLSAALLVCGSASAQRPPPPEVSVVANLAGLGAGRDTAVYLKASNTGAYERFGQTVALSADGGTLVVGAVLEDSGTSGIDGDQSDFSAPNAGAVYVFARSGDTWAQQAYIKPSNTEAGDRFGFSLALSDDGNTLAVGAMGEDSAATGINGAQDDNSLDTAGAAYVFTRSGAVWSQQAYIKASNAGGPEDGDQFGYAVALSGDGDTLAVGAISEDSAASGINGDEDDDSLADTGAVYVYARSGTAWSQQAYVKPREPESEELFAGILFGFSVGLNGNGDILAVGSYNEDSNRGAIYVLTRSGGAWRIQARLQAANAETGDALGSAVAVSADGNTILAGAFDEDSPLVGLVSPDQGSEDQPTDFAVGAAYVFVRDGDNWRQQAFIKPTNSNVNQHFGWALDISADGHTVVVGAHFQDGAAAGINGDQRDISASDAGAAYVYRRSGDTWTPVAFVKAPNAAEHAEFGISVAVDGDGSVLAIGASREPGASMGVNGDQSDDSAPEAGAVYVY